MCRNNQLIACSLMSFGLGVLIGMLLESRFISCVIALSALGAGFFLLQKK